MEGLIAGGREHVVSVGLPAARDCLIVAHTSRIDQHEVAAYRMTIALADRLALRASRELLQATMDEERAMQEALATLAEKSLRNEVPRA